MIKSSYYMYCYIITLLHSRSGPVVEHELIIIADECFLVAYKSAHRQIY